MARDVQRQNISKERGKKLQRIPDATDRERRQSTASKTASVSDKKPRCRKGVAFANLPKKAQKALDQCAKLFEIGGPDHDQSKKAMEFLFDQV